MAPAKKKTAAKKKTVRFDMEPAKKKLDRNRYFKPRPLIVPAALYAGLPATKKKETTDKESATLAKETTDKESATPVKETATAVEPLGQQLKETPPEAEKDDEEKKDDDNGKEKKDDDDAKKQRADLKKKLLLAKEKLQRAKEQKAEAAEKKRAEEVAAKKKMAEDEAAKKKSEVAAEKKAEDEMAEDEAAKKKSEVAAEKKAEDEAAKKKSKVAAEKKKAEDEAATNKKAKEAAAPTRSDSTAQSLGTPAATKKLEEETAKNVEEAEAKAAEERIVGPPALETAVVTGDVLLAWAPYAGDPQAGVLTLRVGDSIRLSKHCPNGWSYGVNESTEQKGYFAMNHVRLEKVPASGGKQQFLAAQKEQTQLDSKPCCAGVHCVSPHIKLIADGPDANTRICLSCKGELHSWCGAASPEANSKSFQCDKCGAALGVPFLKGPPQYPPPDPSPTCCTGARCKLPKVPIDGYRMTCIECGGTLHGMCGVGYPDVDSDTVKCMVCKDKEKPEIICLDDDSSDDDSVSSDLAGRTVLTKEFAPSPKPGFAVQKTNKGRFKVKDVSSKSPYRNIIKEEDIIISIDRISLDGKELSEVAQLLKKAKKDYITVMISRAEEAKPTPADRLERVSMTTKQPIGVPPRRFSDLNGQSANSKLAEIKKKIAQYATMVTPHPVIERDNIKVDTSDWPRIGVALVVYNPYKESSKKGGKRGGHSKKHHADPPKLTIFAPQPKHSPAVSQEGFNTLTGALKLAGTKNFVPGSFKGFRLEVDTGKTDDESEAEGKDGAEGEDKEEPAKRETRATSAAKNAAAKSKTKKRKKEEEDVKKTKKTKGGRK